MHYIKEGLVGVKKRSFSPHLHDQGSASKDAREDNSQAAGVGSVKGGVSSALLANIRVRRTSSGGARGRGLVASAGAGGAGIAARGARGGRARGRGSAVAAGAGGSVGAGARGGRASAGGGHGGAGGGRGDGVLGTAWVVDTACGLAGGVVGSARVDALVAELSALEVGDGLGVHGGVGGLAVAAGALVVEGGLFYIEVS